MNKAKRASFLLGNISLDGFQKDGEYFLSQSQVAEAVGVHKYEATRFTEELRKNQGYTGHKNEGVNDFKTLPDKGYTGHILEIESNGNGKRGGSRVKVISPETATLFWGYQARKGNDKALGLICACAEETIQRRLDRAFEQVKTEEEYEKATGIKYQTWLESRAFLKDAHASFTNCCLYNDFVAAVAHDKITIAVCGMTASELRELDVIEGNSKVGLNHVRDKETLVKIAKVKLEFSRYRTGNVDQRVERAIKAVNN
ncbi:hypothetical protein [Nostoc sp. TCL26-01]|uniref:hypothetical protein n=1 Tax=Nostoc sp. TCL26-01 TaxID=2576904 RepID=UPI0015BCDB68|nr:hypothetical protein [Nostoc sp. TCL26-01]QLE58749.1 hypothetical protein FD725_26550 [Nostoc sp. TCL26-01]